MVRLTDGPAMTIAIDLGRKATKQINKTSVLTFVLDAQKIGHSLMGWVFLPSPYNICFD